MGEIAEKASLAERRANALAGEMEEARSLLDSAERGKRQTEAELAESRNAVNEMTSRLTRTRRTRIACLSWPPSYNRRSRLTRNRLRRPRRLLLSTWPSSGRLSRSLKKLRNVPSLPRLGSSSKDDSLIPCTALQCDPSISY